MSLHHLRTFTPKPTTQHKPPRTSQIKTLGKIFCQILLKVMASAEQTLPRNSYSAVSANSRLFLDPTGPCHG
jgi:hypothetical protein